MRVFRPWTRVFPALCLAVATRAHYRISRPQGVLSVWGGLPKWGKYRHYRPHRHYSLGWIPRGGSSTTEQSSPPKTATENGTITTAVEHTGPSSPSAVPQETSNTSSVPSILEEELLNDNNNNNSTTTTLPKDVLPKWKAALPPLLQRKGDRTLQRLVMGDVEIFLLGTAHVSKDSCRDVQLLLEAVQPACIFVELCDARIPLLDGRHETNDADMANNTAPQLPWRQRVAHIQQSQGGSTWQAICTLLLTSVQEDYADTLGVELGCEFQAAHRYWQAQRQLQLQRYRPSHFPVLILGDRPLSLTLVRAWESLRWWAKAKVLGGLLWSSWRKPNPAEIREWLEAVLRDESDILTESLADLQKHFPSLHTTIIGERDAWLAGKLVQTCRVLQGAAGGGDGNHPRVQMVAIVGAGHVPGIVQRLTGTMPLPTNQTVEAMLLELCQTRRWAKDSVMQTQVIPQWVHDVTQVQDVDL